MKQPTIYEALKSALGREPTNAEINEKCRAIIAAGIAEGKRQRREVSQMRRQK